MTIPRMHGFRVGRLCQGMVSREGGWIRFGARVNGRGFGIRSHKNFPPLFSERYNGRHGIKKRLYVHVGHWCFATLR